MGGITQKLHSEDELVSKNTGIRKDVRDEISTVKHPHLDDEAIQKSMHGKKKNKRKRKHVNDLRFETTEELGVTGSKRKERKKQ